LSDDLFQRIEYLGEKDRALVAEAYAFAREAHAGQRRLTGDPYLTHPVAVAEILADLRLDGATLAAALLHDVVEDAGVTKAEIEARFGAVVAELVDGVTKLERLEDRSFLEVQAENVRKMLLAMARDLRVVLIKLADRLHNMRTLRPLPVEKQVRIAKETLDIYAPLAHRLGIYKVKWELEDLALRYLDPEAYHELAEMVAQKRAERESYLAEVAALLRQKLAEHGIEADIHGRPKGFYSIYQKMHRQGKAFSEIYDLFALRVIVSSVRECYAALGIVHTLFKPIPGRFKDYIAMPKTNLYQSLHTTVIGPEGRPFEVQIRTQEMHRTAEYGIAAHWVYKEGRTDPRLDQKLSWLRRLIEMQGETREAQEFLDSLKVDLFSDEVYVFTPKGAVLELPADATPVDFAFRIHTDIGYRCVGAKANGHIVPLDYKLQNGDIIEILTSKTAQGPSADWLQFVKTSTARNRIRQWFKAKNREENIRLGQQLFEREARRLGLDPAQLRRDEWLDEVRRRFNFQSVDDLWAAVGYGGVSAGQVVGRLKERLPAQVLPLPDGRSADGFGRPSNGIRVRGADNLLVRVARCCTPVPGDPIVGYITRGRGVSVHRTDCPNVEHLAAEGERLIDVAWDRHAGETYPVELEIHGLDRAGLLADVASVLAARKLNIAQAKARGYRNHKAVVTVLVEIRHLGELAGVMEDLRRIPDVTVVQRVAREKAN
jgi:guanosine-3',5'-bis(diphosphate) 3'-pyrophosphohydrolase